MSCFKLLFVPTLLVALLGACGDGAPSDPEEAGSQLAGVYDDLADELEGVQTEADLEAARPELAALAERLVVLRDQYEALAEGHDAEELWEQGSSPELMKAQQRMSQAIMKVGMNPALSQKLSEVMSEFGDAFEKR